MNNTFNVKVLTFLAFFLRWFQQKLESDGDLTADVAIFVTMQKFVRQTTAYRLLRLHRLQFVDK